MSEITPAGRRRAVKRQAKRLLEEGNHLFALLMAALAVMFAAIALSVAVDGFFAFFDFGVYAPEPPADAVLSWTRLGLHVLLFVLVVFPLWYGMCALARNCIGGERAAAADVFCAFDSPHMLFRVWRGTLWILWRAALSVGLLTALWQGIAIGRAYLIPLGYAALVAGGVLLTPFCLLPLVGTTMLYPLMLARPDLGVWTACRQASRLTWRHFGELFVFWFSFLPWFALGLATGGVLLLLFVLPYVLLAHACYVPWLSRGEEARVGAAPADGRAAWY